MNVLPTDNRDRKEACTTNDMKENINNKFEFNLYKNIGDVFGNENSQRQFYTMPSTTIPNNRKDFADWLSINTSNMQRTRIVFHSKNYI